MDNETRIKLIEIYKKCSDDDLNQMIQEGKESFEGGAFELILSEAKKRGVGDKGFNNAGDDGDYVVNEEIDFDNMRTEDLMGVLVNIHNLNELNFHLASAEAIRRNIDSSDIRAYKKIVQCEECPATPEPVEIALIENPRPLIILKTIDEADLYTDVLEEEGIPFEIQIIIDDKDYRKAEMVTNSIMISQEDE